MFKIGSGPLKNMAPRGRGSIPYLAIAKSCEHSRGRPIIMKLAENIGFIDISYQFENGPDRQFSLYAYSKNM